MNFNFQTEEEYSAARENFFKTHPDAREPQDVECLNLIMKREYAEQILAGTKKLEFRSYSPFYTKRLIDEGVQKYIGDHIDDDEVVFFLSDIRQVKRIHFHNYNNSWFLDIEVDYTDAFTINRTDIGYLQKEFECHDWDLDLDYYERENVPEKERPYYFYFVCGKVLATDLKR